MNGLALCAGAGGLERGVELAVGDAYRTVCAVEWEAAASSLLVARQQDGNFTPFPVWDSVATFDGKPWRGVVDIVTAGFPCQPFSTAGKRRAFEDERHIWPHIARIVSECKPELVFLENVPGLLSTRTLDGSYAYETVEADLQAMDYDVAPCLVTAAEVGATHQRERLFILAHRDGVGGERRDIDAGGESETGRRDVADATLDGRAFIGKSRERRPRFENRSKPMVDAFPPGPGDAAAWRRILAERPDLAPALSINQEWEFGFRYPLAARSPQSTVRGMVDGLPDRVDLPRTARLRILGNAVVAPQAAYAFSILRKQLIG